MTDIHTPQAVPDSDSNNRTELNNRTEPNNVADLAGLLSRRTFIGSTSLAALSYFVSGVNAMPTNAQDAPATAQPIMSSASSSPNASSNVVSTRSVLQEFGYADVRFQPCLQQAQFEATINTLLAISDDDMLKPFRVRAGLPAPGAGIGGWYDENPNYDWRQAGDSVGFAPGHCFGQWLSALSRAYAINGSQPTLAKLKRLLKGYGETITPAFYDNFRFPAYTYDKLVCGLLDAQLFAGLSEASELLDRTTDAALPNLPPRALNRGEPIPAHPERDDSFRWDESYTLPENLLRAFEAGSGDRYRDLANRFLLDKGFFDELAVGNNALIGRHAYSFMNSLSSAMRAYLVTGSQKHLKAAVNAFQMIRDQSFSSGGWGPDETFVKPGAGTLGKSLEEIGGTHQSFETCGGYAHMKLTRYLLRVTGDARYGDSMEQVILNTVLGVKPMLADGSTFYYSDYNNKGRKIYYRMKCPCCAGTLPQIVADYRICTYFHDAEGPTVNLYVPSTLKWKQDGADFSLTQMTKYPLDGRVGMRLTAEAPREFTLKLRIPAWATGASIRVNGRTVRSKVLPGTFASVHRLWTSGDLVLLTLPMTTRLEAIDNEHPDTVALSCGPLALFALHDGQSIPKVAREQLLAARKIRNTSSRTRAEREDEWVVQAADGVIRLVPFTSIKDEEYSAYLQVET